MNTYAPKSREVLIDFALQHKKILVAVNAEKILHATDKTRDLINRNLGYPDGIGAVMALKKKGVQDVIKIPGVELWLDIVKKHSRDKTFYLIGSREEVIQRTVEKLKLEFPGIKIVNFRNGYLRTEEEKSRLKDDIIKRQPDIVFVAMGSPKQELLMEELHSLHPALYQGLGGSFDVFDGSVERAPEWWVRNSLEWAYRLLKQPARIKRQIHLLRFFFELQTNKY